MVWWWYGHIASYCSIETSSRRWTDTSPKPFLLFVRLWASNMCHCLLCHNHSLLNRPGNTGCKTSCWTMFDWAILSSSQGQQDYARLQVLHIKGSGAWEQLGHDTEQVDPNQFLLQSQKPWKQLREGLVTSTASQFLQHLHPSIYSTSSTPHSWFFSCRQKNEDKWTYSTSSLHRPRIQLPWDTHCQECQPTLPGAVQQTSELDPKSF